MSVRYTATWYDVTQARQQEHTPYTQTRTGPAGRSSVLSLTQYRCDRQLGGTVYAGVIGSKWRSSVCDLQLILIVYRLLVGF